MIKKSFPGMLFLFFLIFFFQSSTYNYETLDWDVNAFLVTSLELGRGNLPFETQYENKPPLLFAIFYFFTIVANKNLLIIKKKLFDNVRVHLGFYKQLTYQNILNILYIYIYV